MAAQTFSAVGSPPSPNNSKTTALAAGLALALGAYFLLRLRREGARETHAATNSGESEPYAVGVDPSDRILMGELPPERLLEFHGDWRQPQELDGGPKDDARIWGRPVINELEASSERRE